MKSRPSLVAKSVNFGSLDVKPKEVGSRGDSVVEDLNVQSARLIKLRKANRAMANAGSLLDNDKLRKSLNALTDLVKKKDIKAPAVRHIGSWKTRLSQIESESLNTEDFMSDTNKSNSTEEVKPQRISLSQLNIAKTTEETSFLKAAPDRKYSQ